MMSTHYMWWTVPHSVNCYTTNSMFLLVFSPARPEGIEQPSILACRTRRAPPIPQSSTPRAAPMTALLRRPPRPLLTLQSTQQTIIRIIWYDRHVCEVSKVPKAGAWLLNRGPSSPPHIEHNSQRSPAKNSRICRAQYPDNGNCRVIAFAVVCASRSYVPILHLQ